MIYPHFVGSATSDGQNERCAQRRGVASCPQQISKDGLALLSYGRGLELVEKARKNDGTCKSKLASRQVEQHTVMHTGGRNTLCEGKAKPFP